MEELIKFTIHGNQEDPEGNAIGYKRTLNHSWRKDATKYKEWQHYVLSCYATSVDPPHYSDEKPFGKGVRGSMAVVIEWANCRHADPDNVWKGIADALFKDDKHLDGSFTATHSKEKRGRVEVTIRITTQTQ